VNFNIIDRIDARGKSELRIRRSPTSLLIALAPLPLFFIFGFVLTMFWILGTTEMPPAIIALLTATYLILIAAHVRFAFDYPRVSFAEGVLSIHRHRILPWSDLHVEATHIFAILRIEPKDNFSRYLVCELHTGNRFQITDDDDIFVTDTVEAWLREHLTQTNRNIQWELRRHHLGIQPPILRRPPRFKYDVQQPFQITYSGWITHSRAHTTVEFREDELIVEERKWRKIKIHKWPIRSISRFEMKLSIENDKDSDIYYRLATIIAVFHDGQETHVLVKYENIERYEKVEAFGWIATLMNQQLSQRD
jgi:hypothetical protein